MNLYFLLEGRRTEPQVYRRWLGHAFPALREVGNARQMTDGCFRVRSAGGYPEILQRIAGSVDEVKRADVSLETFFVCLDAEEESYDDRYAEVVGLLQKLSPPFHFTVIIQDCCIETWLLGNRPLLRPVTRTAELRELMEFYNVRVRDPEGMPKKEGYETRARFHGDYFKAVLRDRSRGLKEEGLRSTKRRIGIVGERQYFESLIERHEETQHLRSFGHLLSAWRGLGARI